MWYFEFTYLGSSYNSSFPLDLFNLRKRNLAGWQYIGIVYYYFQTLFDVEIPFRFHIHIAIWILSIIKISPQKVRVSFENPNKSLMR